MIMCLGKEKMKRPKVSVLMAVHNEKEYLKQSIESVLNQSFKDFEFIIIDDCSDTKTKKILKGYKDKRIKILYNKKNLGLTKSLNKAIKISKGEYIARMDVDDISLPNRFSKQVRFLDHHPKIVVLGSAYYLIDKDNPNKIKKKRKFFSKDRQIKRQLCLKTKMAFISHPSVMMHKKALLDVGLYNEDFLSTQDKDLFIRMAGKGFKFANLKEPLLKRRPGKHHSPDHKNHVYKINSKIIDALCKKYNVINPEEKSNELNIILITKSDNAIAKAQIFPFYLYKKELKEKFGLIFNELKINDNSDALSKLDVDFSKYDVMFVQKRALRDDVEFLKSIEIKKVFLDDSASSGTCLFNILPYINVYLKKQFLKNLEKYKKPYLGKRYYADYLIKLYNIKEPHKKSQLLKVKYKNKLVLGWNFLISKRFYRQLRKQRYRIFKKRKIDISCRIRLGDNKSSEPKWIYFHRFFVLNNLKKLKNKYKIIATNRLISIRSYLRELKKSKICVSPFGFGEICWRDFEAIMCGCLLVKPKMEHLITEPDIFIPNKTYVPVKWDLSDLNEKCEYFLTHDEEREEIIKNAKEASEKYFQERKFVEKIGEILCKLGFDK